MNQEEIIAFIQKHTLDASPEAIKDALVSSGVSEEDIDQAWKKIAPPAHTTEVPPVAATPVVPVIADEAWEATLLSNGASSAPALPSSAEQPVPVTEVTPPPAAVVLPPVVNVPTSANQISAANVSVRRHSAKFPAVMIVIASFVIGGGAFAYWSFIESALSPAEVFKNMAMAFETVTSGTYGGTIELTFEEGVKKQGQGLPTAVYSLIQPLLLAQDTAELSPQGSGDAKKSIRATLSVSGGFDESDSTNRMDSFEGKLHASVMGQEVDIEMNARMTGGASYIKFRNISQTVPGLKKFEDEWIKFDLASVQALSRGAEDETSKKAAEEKLKDVSARSKERIAALFEKTHLFTLLNRGKETTRAGVSAYHYGLELDKEGLRQFLDGLLAIVYEEGIQKETFSVAPPSKEAADESITSALDALQETGGEIWIGTEDFLPYRSEITFTMQEPTGSVFRFKAQVDFDDWNKPLSVTAPTKSIGIEEVISSLGFGSGNANVLPTDGDAGHTTNAISTAQTEHWKTYRNEKYGFEFKYPERWHDNSLSVKEESNVSSSSRIYVGYGKGVYPGGYGGHPFSFEVSENMTLEKGILEIEGLFSDIVKKFPETKSSTTTVSVGGETAKQFFIVNPRLSDENKLGSEIGHLITLLERDGVLYVFASRNVSSAYQDLYSQIVLSIKFVE